MIVSTGDLHARLRTWIAQESDIPDRTKQSPAPRPLHPRPQLRSEYHAPQSEIEHNLVNIWQELLGLAEVGIFDSFFELGGDSLLGIEMIAQVKQQFGRVLSPVAIYESPTIRELADAMAETELERCDETSATSQDRGKRRRQRQYDRLDKSSSREDA